MTYDQYIDMLYEERLNFEHTEIVRVQSDNISVIKNKHYALLTKTKTNSTNY